MSSSSSSSSGIGFVGMLTIAFVVLKLCEVIDWSWWWVLSPIWICALLVVAILLVAGFIVWFDGRGKKEPTDFCVVRRRDR